MLRALEAGECLSAFKMNLTEFIACAKFKSKGNSGLLENQIEQYTQRRREYTFRNATENSRMVRRDAGWDEEDGF